MRGVVTGAAGFIGSHLVTRLLHGGTVVGVDNERSGDWARVPPECDRVERDLATMDVPELETVVAGADVCFHLAAEKYNSSRSTPERVIDVNISATHRLFEACARAGVPKVVFTSSLYAYGSLGPAPMRESDPPAPTTMYGMSKVAGEHMLRVAQRDHGLSWSVARLFFVYGPNQHAEGGYRSVIVSNFERLRNGERPTIYGDGTQALDYVFVDDVVDGLVTLAAPEHDGALLNFGTGTAISVDELTKKMLATADRDVEPLTCPPDWTAGSVRVADVGTARRTIGWAPSISIDEGLRRVWESEVASVG